MYNDIDKSLIGNKVLKIYMNEDFLKFETDKGNVVFGVDGDCCSQSVFYDFIGVKKLIGNFITRIEEIELHPEDIIEVDGEQKDKKSYQESIQAYGYRLITEDKQLGEVSSVFSFRNYSNGYYGGSMRIEKDQEVKPEIFDDVIETINSKD